MKQPDEREDFLELLRLAYVAGSEAAEYVVDKTELVNDMSLQQLKKGDAILALNENSKIKELFIKYGKKHQTYYQIDNAILYENNNLTILKILYTFNERKKKRITMAALKAIKHVLSSYEEITLSTLE
jgi:hypothetical protein